MAGKANVRRIATMVNATTISTSVKARGRINDLFLTLLRVRCFPSPVANVILALDAIWP